MDNQKVSGISIKVLNLFGLSTQARELVSRTARSLKSKNTCLLFLDGTSENYTILSCKPALKNNHLSGLTVRAGNSAVQKLLKERKVLVRENNTPLPVLNELFGEYAQEIDIDRIEILAPLISSDRLIGILLIECRESGSYTPEEIDLVNMVILRVAPGMEKEYLREKLDKRVKELSVINHCCSILTSSMDIEKKFGEFIGELKNLVDIEWAALMLIENESMYILGLYSEIGTSWQTGDRMKVKGTATEWVAASRMPLVESDLKKDSLFVTDVYHRKQGIHSVVCVPLILNEEVTIGSLIVGVCKPNVYTPGQVEFLREIASRIARPVENARLYAEVLRKSRYDELTGLLNRRSMDEQIVSEVNRHSRYGGVFSLIILDLDGMKTTNDKYGHLAGDGLLARTGSILKESVRSADQAFRYGGDEFAILLPNTPSNAALRVSERVRRQLASKLVVDDVSVTASFGLASWPDNGTEANDIIAAADSALYKAKGKGGNQVYLSENSS